MTAAEIAAALGDAGPDGNGWWKCRCPVCGKVALSLHDNPASRVKLSVKPWCGCNKTEVRKKLKAGNYLNGHSGGDEGGQTPEDWMAEIQAALKKAAAERQKGIDKALDNWRNRDPIIPESLPAVYIAGRLSNSRPIIPECLGY